MNFEIESRESFTAAEVMEAKRHWSSIGVRPFYVRPQPWAASMTQRILKHEPASVLEFGCNAGRNLLTIREAAPQVRLSGLDINGDAVRVAVEQGLDVVVGDETTLAQYGTGSVDVSFTISVLDHLPEPSLALQELARISRKAILLLEPWVGSEGKVLRNSSHSEVGQMVDTTPYSYSWDYGSLTRAVAPDWSLKSEPHPLGPAALGPYYFMYELMPA